MNTISAMQLFAVGSWILVSGGAWTPTPEQLSEIRNSLEPFVKQQAVTLNKKLPTWSSYTFQYQGELDDGHKVVFIKASCSPLPDYAQQQFAIVLDGGTCIFEVKYDLNKKRFFQLMFNGEA